MTATKSSAYDYTIWTQPFYTNQLAEVVDRYNNPAYLFLQEQGLEWNGNLCTTADFLMQNCPEAFIAALTGAMNAPQETRKLDRCWTGNIYADSNTYVVCEVDTVYGAIPFCAYYKDLASRSHVGYDERVRSLNRE